MANTKPPVDLVGASGDSVLQQYKAGIAARAAARRVGEQRNIPNLAQANEQFRPTRDGPMSLATMQKAQNLVDPPEKGSVPGLSQDTLAGLKAINDAARQHQQQHPPQGPKTMETAATTQSTDQRIELPEDVKKKQLEEKVKDLDDLEFDRMMRAIQTDIINNEKEREAVRKRVKPIDLAEGLASGQFTQDVAIRDGLTIRYRSVSSLENQHIRLLLFDWIDKDPKKENMSAELYGLMLSVASIVRINTNELPSHLVGPDHLSRTFNEDVFTKKFNLFCSYPMPLIHAIAVHGSWFDMRVRELFTSDNLKNG